MLKWKWFRCVQKPCHSINCCASWCLSFGTKNEGIEGILQPRHDWKENERLYPARSCRDLVWVIRCRMRIRNNFFETTHSFLHVFLLCLQMRNWRQWRQGHFFFLEHTDMQQCSRKRPEHCSVTKHHVVTRKQVVDFCFCLSLCLLVAGSVAYLHCPK